MEATRQLDELQAPWAGDSFESARATEIFTRASASAHASDVGRGSLQLLRECGTLLQTAAGTAGTDLDDLDSSDAAEYAAVVEDLSRTVEYLQVVAAGLVDRVRREANAESTSDQRATGPASDEYRNAAEYLRASLRLTSGEARRRVALAAEVLPRRGLSGLPMPAAREELAAAMASGSASSKAATVVTMALDRVRPLCDQATADRIEDSLTRTAVECDGDFLARVARHWVEAVDQDGGEPSEELLRQRQGAFLRRSRNGLQHIELFATTDQLEHLITVMNSATNPRLAGGVSLLNDEADAACARDGASVSEAADSRDLAGGATGGVTGGSPSAGVRPDAALDRRTRAQRMLDGLVGACKVAMSSGALPAAGGLRPQVLVTISHQDLLASLEGSGRLKASGVGTSRDGVSGGWASWGAVSGDGASWGGESRAVFSTPELGGGVGTFAFSGPVAAANVRKLACDADILPVVLGGEGQVLDIGRASRVFPMHIRKAITARDLGCAFPGCTMPAPWCEAHHIQYWSMGGATSTDNGTLLCSHHHHLIHKEEWRIEVRERVPWFVPPPHIDPRCEPRRNRYFHMRH